MKDDLKILFMKWKLLKTLEDKKVTMKWNLCRNVGEKDQSLIDRFLKFEDIVESSKEDLKKDKEKVIKLYGLVDIHIDEEGCYPIRKLK